MCSISVNNCTIGRGRLESRQELAGGWSGPGFESTESTQLYESNPTANDILPLSTNKNKNKYSTIRIPSGDDSSFALFVLCCVAL